MTADLKAVRIPLGQQMTGKQFEAQNAQGMPVRTYEPRVGLQIGHGPAQVRKGMRQQTTCCS